MLLSPAHSRLRLIPIVLAQVVGVLCGVAGVKLNSKLIPPDVLGAFGVFLTLTPIGIWVVHAGIVKFVSRRWAAAESRPKLLRATVRIWIQRLPWLAGAAALSVISVRAMSGGHSVLLWLALFCATALWSAGAIAQAALQAEASHWKDCLVSVSGSLSRTLLPPVFFALAGGSVIALWGGFGLHTLILAAAGAWALQRYWRSDSTVAAHLELGAVYSGPLFITLAAANWILAGFNRWVVATAFGTVEAGYLTLAGGAAVVLASTLGTAFVQYFQPGIFALGDSPSASRALLARRIDWLAGTYTVAALAIVAGFAAGAPQLVGPLIDAKYAPGLGWIFPAGCFVIATNSASFYHTLLLAGRRESACGPVDLTTAAVLIAGGIFAAGCGLEWFKRWLILAPLVPWALTRTMARSYLFKPDGASTPAPAR